MNKSLTMITHKISCAITTRSYRYNSYHNLNLHRHFSKVSASQVNTFRYNIKNQSSCFPLSSELSRRRLLYVPSSSNLESHRNFSSILQDLQKFFQAEKDDAAVESTPNALPDAAKNATVESTPSELQSEGFSFNISDFLDNVSFSSIIKYLESYMVEVHEVTGLPWWATIALTAIMFRTSIVLPVAAGQIVFMTRIRKIDFDVKKLVPAIKEQIAFEQKKFRWTDEIAKRKLDIAIKRKWNGFVYDNNCHPMKKYILPIVQVPLWLTLTVVTRNLCIPNPSDVSNEVYSELSTGGFAWVTDLTVGDPYMILPISLALVNLAIIEVHQLFRVDSRTKEEQRQAMFFRSLSIGLIPVAAYLPAAVNIYWLTSSLYGLTQSFILHSALVRRILELPVPEPAAKYPYRLLKKNVQLRLGMNTSKGKVQLITCKFNAGSMHLIFSSKND